MGKKSGLKCLFGFHDYTHRDLNNPHVLLCKHCKRFGQYIGVGEYRSWYEYDEKGEIIHYKNSEGHEERFRGE